MRTITNLRDSKLRIDWLDAINLVFGWICMLDDSLFLTCIGAFLFAVTLGQIWLKWKVWREYPLLRVF